MHTNQLDDWSHDHVFNQDKRSAGERRTLVIVILTAVMMVAEITAGLVYRSMALLADGLHMASHTVALGIAVLAYVVSRRLASDRRFAFGVGKINSLAGFASAVTLLGFALLMMVESTERLINPLEIAFDQALIVAGLGLMVNGISAWFLLSTPHSHGHGDSHHEHHHGHDHNLRAAYLHVIADALTSLLAIFALLAGKYFGISALDPVMGIVGALLVTKWSISLIRETARVLLDRQLDEKSQSMLIRSIEGDSSDRITDLHVWSIGHGIFASEMAIVSHTPKTPDEYKSMIPQDLNIVHSTIEVHRCTDTIAESQEPVKMA